MARQTISLNGDVWQLGQAPLSASPKQARWDELSAIRDWIPAVVPGNVQADLVRAGRLPDPMFGTQAEAARASEEHCWWLLREFSLTAEPDRRVYLVLRGVDYIHDLFLNGHFLGRHEGMFSPQVHDVTRWLRPDNRLAVRILASRWLPEDRSSAWEKVLNKLEAAVSALPSDHPQRRDTLKCQMGFGWDFAPVLRTMGIWDDVHLVLTGGPLIRHVSASSRLLSDEAVVTVGAEILANPACSLWLRAKLASEAIDDEPAVAESKVDVLPGVASQSVQLTVRQPRLWWPWDHGQPELYRLTLELWQEGRCLDSITETIGLRQVELDRWTLRINGQRVYVRGANWVPASVFPGVLSDADYEALLALARHANMNLLRVWGGGLREKRAFYDLCDRLGILVWQEFPIACAFLTRYPRSPKFLDLLRDEARAIVRDLRNHPSLALWCGGNEFDPAKNAPVVKALQGVMADEDPSRPFLPVSPGSGDRHNWRVWHRFEPPSAYREDTALFASEFGLQSPPDLQSLRRFIPEEELWPPGHSWEYHGAGLQKLWRYARPFLRAENGADAAGATRPAWRAYALESFVQACNRAQAHALQIGIEHFRRRKAGGCGGLLIWQFNEPWPAVSWALLQHPRQPKPAFDTVRRLLNPILISVEYCLKQYRAGESFTGAVWVINDTNVAIPDCVVEATLWDGDGLACEGYARSIDVPADSAMADGRVCWTLPPGKNWRLTCTLTSEGMILASNSYNLSVHDDIRPNARQRLRTWLIGQIFPA